MSLVDDALSAIALQQENQNTTLSQREIVEIVIGVVRGNDL